MFEQTLKINVSEWVERAKADPVAYLQRQATEVTLNVIAMTAIPGKSLVLKGGILMGLVYDSPRHTTDIDLSSEFDAESKTDERIRSMFDNAFPRALANLGYADLVMKIHSIKKQPNKRISKFEEADFPALKLKISFAKRGTKQEVAMKAGKATSIVDVDISFNEPLQQIQILELTGGQELLAYSQTDLLAEKYRAMLQQVTRNRNRRQDVYDIHLIIERMQIDESTQTAILKALFIKCRSRRIEPAKDSLDNPEVKKRSAAEWDTMELEIGDVPEFENCFRLVREFYWDLPWE